MEKRTALTEVHRVETNGLVWMAVHGTVCLGLRHPSHTGASRALVLGFVHELGERLVEWGVLTPAEFAVVNRVEQEEQPSW